jgi:biotin carboxyl carrier protein
MKILARNGAHHEEINIIKQEGPILQVAIGEREYTLDVEKVEKGVYSVLHNGISHNMEIIKSERKHFYTVNTHFQSFDIEISPIKSITNNSKKSANTTETSTAPIPGKVISLKVSPGDRIKEYQTVLILSAMKMENELKSPIDGIITSVKAKKDDVVNTGEVLIEVKGEVTP